MSNKLEIIIGCMFSGKSTELQRCVRRLATINIPYMIINNNLDDRYSIDGKCVVCTHNDLRIDCVSLKNLNDIYLDNIYHSELLKKYNESQYIFIEEAQFFPDLYEFVLNAVNKDLKNVQVYGLDGDFRQEPFGDILKLIPHADHVHKLKSLCKSCNDGTTALFTIRDIDLIDSDKVTSEQILVGTDDLYKTVCRKHLLEYNKKLSLNLL